jgi:hypothetical protein
MYYSTFYFLSIFKIEISPYTQDNYYPNHHTFKIIIIIIIIIIINEFIVLLPPAAPAALELSVESGLATTVNMNNKQNIVIKIIEFILIDYILNKSLEISILMRFNTNYMKQSKTIIIIIIIIYNSHALQTAA